MARACALIRKSRVGDHVAVEVVVRKSGSDTDDRTLMCKQGAFADKGSNARRPLPEWTTVVIG